MSEQTELLMVLAQNIPAAVAVIVVVWMFLRSQKQQVATFQERMIAAAEQCHETQNRSTAALMRHAEAAAKQAEALGANSQSLQQLIMTVMRCQNGQGGGGE